MKHTFDSLVNRLDDSRRDLGTPRYKGGLKSDIDEYLNKIGGDRTDEILELFKGFMDYKRCGEYGDTYRMPIINLFGVVSFLAGFLPAEDLPIITHLLNHMIIKKMRAHPSLYYSMTLTQCQSDVVRMPNEELARFGETVHGVMRDIIVASLVKMLS